VKPKKSDLRATIEHLEALLRLERERADRKWEQGRLDRQRYDKVLKAFLQCAGYETTTFVASDAEVPTVRIEETHVHVSDGVVSGHNVILGEYEERGTLA